MADQKISALPQITLADADSFPVVDASDPATERITWANFKAVLDARYAPIETYSEVAATGSTENIDMDVAYQRKTMDQNCTFSFTNKAGAGEAKVAIVYIEGAFTPTLHADADFGASGTPTYSDGMTFAFWSFDGETKIVAAAIGTGGFTP